MWKFLFLELVLLRQFCRAQTTWLFPKQDQTFNYNDIIVAQWTTTYDNPYFDVWAPDSDNVSTISWLSQEVGLATTYSYTFAAASSYFFPFESSFEISNGVSNTTQDSNGVGFTVTSTVGLPTTYEYTTTITSAAVTTSSSTSPSQSIPTVTTTTTFSASSTSTVPSSTSTPMASSTSISDSSSSSLSEDAKIGIGVGGAAAFLVICGIVAWIFITKRRARHLAQKLQNTKEESSDEESVGLRHEVGDGEKEEDTDISQGPSELDGRQRSELEGVVAAELPGISEKDIRG